MRVEAGGRFVEEEDGRAVDERGRQVEPAPHPARVGAGHAVGGVGETEALEQLVGPGDGRRPAQVREPPDEAEVLAAGEVAVDRGVLAGEADAGSDRVGPPGHVEAEDLGVAAVGREHGGQDPDGGRLAGAVGAEHAEDGAGRHLEVDAGQRLEVTEALGEALDPDRGGLGVRVLVVGHGWHPIGYA